jgi:hypothetical protein
MTVPTSTPAAYGAQGSGAGGGAPTRPAAELSLIAEVSDEAKALLDGDGGALAPKAFIALLVERELFPDAVRILAHALPKREAVWWAWVCARKAAGADPAPPVKAALEATERWITLPSEDNRRQAMQKAEAADFVTPAGCAALAVFMTGGSLAPPDAPVTPPGEFMAAKAVAGSVTLAAVKTDPEHAPEKFRDFIKMGLEVADRTKLWGA